MKTTRFFRKATTAALSASFLLVLAAASPAANLVYYVSLDVSSLVSKPDGQFSLDFQLVPGSDNVSNTVTISNFTVVGGSLLGTPSYSAGGASGSMLTSVTLTNSDPADNEYAALFSTGVTKIQFMVTETSNSETVGSGTPIPEQFNAAILDNQLGNILTTDPSGGNTLISSAIVAGQTLSSVQTYSSTGTDGGVNVTTSLNVIPEPGSASLLLVGACAMMARRKRSAAPAVA